MSAGLVDPFGWGFALRSICREDRLLAGMIAPEVGLFVLVP
jgi:hypothetical protein